MEEDRVTAEAGGVTEAVAQVMEVREAALAEVMVAMMEVKTNKQKKTAIHIIYSDLILTNMSCKD